MTDQKYPTEHRDETMERVLRLHEEDDKTTAETKITEAIMRGFHSLTTRQKATIESRVKLAVSHAQNREIEDMCAFIAWATERKSRPTWVAGALFHDVNGIAHPEPCFTPRTSGYSDLIKQPAA